MVIQPYQMQGAQLRLLLQLDCQIVSLLAPTEPDSGQGILLGYACYYLMRRC